MHVLKDIKIQNGGLPDSFMHVSFKKVKFAVNHV